MHPLPFYLSEEAAAGGLPIRQQLDAAVEDARGFGVPVKARLLCREFAAMAWACPSKGVNAAAELRTALLAVCAQCGVLGLLP